MTVEWRGPLPLSNYAVGRAGRVIDRIVLHTTVGWIAAADAQFHNQSSEVSAHFGVRIDGALWQWVQIPDTAFHASAHFGVRIDGALWQWVQIPDTAFHAGDLEVDYRSIGIEHEDSGEPNAPRPDALYARSAALVAQFCREYRIPLRRAFGAAGHASGIYDHRQIVATGCPDELDTDRIICMARAVL